MSNLKYNLVIVLFAGLCGCTSEEMAENGLINLTASANSTLTKAGTSNEGELIIGEKFFLYNTASTPSQTNQSLFAQYSYQGKSIPCNIEDSHPLTWETIKREGNKYYFTARSLPEIEAVYTDQSSTNFKESDLLIARATISVKERGTTIHLPFCHVLSRVDIEVWIPVNGTNFPQSVILKDAKLINKKYDFTVTYSTSTETGKIMPVTAGNNTSDIILNTTKAFKVENNYKKYSLSAIIPNQIVQAGNKFAQFTIDGKPYTYTASGDVGKQINLKQGEITRIVLKLQNSDDVFLELESVKQITWEEAIADIDKIWPDNP